MRVWVQPLRRRRWARCGVDSVAQINTMNGINSTAITNASVLMSCECNWLPGRHTSWGQTLRRLAWAAVIAVGGRCAGLISLACFCL